MGVRTFSWARDAAHVAAPFDAAFHAKFSAMVVGLEPAVHASFLGDVRAAAAADFRIYAATDPHRAVGPHFADPTAPEVEEPTWVLRDQDGQILMDTRTATPGEPAGSASLMDPRVADWRTELAAYWTTQLSATQLDGIVVENASKGVPWFCLGPENEYPVDYEEGAWQSAIESTIGALQVAGPPGPPHNMLFEGPQRLPGDPETTRTYLTNTGGAYHDTWRGPDGAVALDASLYHRAWYWLDAILIAMESAKAFNHLFFLRARVGDDSSAEARMFALAAFLLKSWDGAYFALSDDEDPKWWPEYETDLGEPLGDMRVEASGVYVRDFEFGQVVVNPLEQTLSFEVPPTYDGQIHDRGLDGDGVGTIQLASLTGDILANGASIPSQFPIVVNVQDFAVGYSGSRQQVATAVIPLARGDLPTNGEQLSAYNALWTSQRTHVQWIGQGEPFRNADGSFHSWQYARCYFEHGSAPGLTKQVTISKQPPEVPPQNFTLASSVATMLDSVIIRVWLNGVATQFPINLATLEQHRVEPATASPSDIVRFYEWTVRLQNEPRMFAWLCMEVCRYQKEVKFWLHLGHSRVRDYQQGNTQDPNLYMGDATNKTLTLTISGGGGVLSYIRSENITTMLKSVQAGVTAWNLLDWSTNLGANELTHNRMPVGTGLGYQGVLLTGSPTESTVAAAEEDLHAVADNWDQTGLAPLGEMPQRPYNNAAQREMTKEEARASLDAWMPTLRAKMVPRRPYGQSSWGTSPEVTQGANQSAAFGASRGWMFLSCGSPAMSRFLQWVCYKQLHRPQNYVNDDGTIYRAWDHPLCMFFGSHPRHAINTDKLGYTTAAISGPQSDAGPGWFGQDKEHWEIHWETTYALTSGDRLAMRWAAMQVENWLSNHHTGMPGDDGRGLGEIGEGWTNNNTTFYNAVSSRGYGRGMNAGLELAQVTGNPDIRYQVQRQIGLWHDGWTNPVNGQPWWIWSGAWHSGEATWFEVINPFIKHPYLERPFIKPWMEGTVVVAMRAASNFYADANPTIASKAADMAWRIGKSLTLFGFWGELGKALILVRASQTTGHPWLPPQPGAIIREGPTGRKARVIGVRFDIRHILVEPIDQPLNGGFTWDYFDDATGVNIFKCSVGNITNPIMHVLLGANVDGNGKPTGVPLTREEMFVLDPDPSSPQIDFANWHYDGSVGGTWAASGVAVALRLAIEKRDVVVARKAWQLLNLFPRSTGFGSENPSEDWLAAAGNILHQPLQHHGRAVGANIGYQVSYRYQTEMWLNVCRAASAWAEFDISENQPTYKPPIGMDVWPNNGYPTAYRPNTFFESVLFGRLNDQGGNPNWKWPRPGSVWRIRATGDGAARLVVHHDNTTTTFANITTLDTTITAAGYSSWKFRLYDGILTSCVMIPDEFTAEYDAGKQLNPRWISKEGGKLEVLRDLNLNGTIGGIYTWPPIQQDGSCTPLCVIQVERWSDRRPKNAYSYNAQFFNSDEWRYDTVGAWTGASALERTVTGRTSGRTGLLRGGVSGTPGSVLVKRLNLAGDLHFTNGEWLDDNFGNSIRLASPMNARFDAITRISEQYCPHDAFVDLCVELYEATGRLRYGWICLQTAAKREGELAHNGVAVPVGDGYVEELGKYIKQKFGPISDAGKPVLVMGFEFSNEVWNPLPGVTDVDYIEDYISRWPQYKDWPFGIKVLNTQALRSNDLMDAIRLQVSGREHLIYRILALQRSPNCDNVYNGRGDSGNDPYIPTWLHHDALAWAPYLDPRGGWMTEPTCEETVDYIEQVPLVSWLAPTNPLNWTGTYATQMARVATIGHGKYEVCYYEGFTHHLRDENPDRFEILQCADRHPRMGGIITQMLDHFHENSAPENWRATLCAMFMLWDPNEGREAWGIWYHPDDTTSPRGIALDTHLDTHYDTEGVDIAARSAVAVTVAMPAGDLPFVWLRAASPIVLDVDLPQGDLVLDQTITALSPIPTYVVLQPGSLVIGGNDVTIWAASPIPTYVVLQAGSVQSGVVVRAFSTIHVPLRMPAGRVSVNVTITAASAIALDVDMAIGSVVITTSETITALSPITTTVAMAKGSLSLPVTIGALAPVSVFAVSAPGTIQYGWTVDALSQVELRLDMAAGQIGLDVVVEALTPVAVTVAMADGSLDLHEATEVFALTPVQLDVDMAVGTVERGITALSPITVALAMPAGSPSYGYQLVAGGPVMMLLGAGDGGLTADVMMAAEDAARMYVAALDGDFEEGFDGSGFLGDLAQQLAKLAHLGQVSDDIVYHYAGQRPGVRMLVIVERFEREPIDPGGRIVRGAYLHIPTPFLDRPVRTDDEITLDLLKGGKQQTVSVAAIVEKTPLEWILEVRE